MISLLTENGKEIYCFQTKYKEKIISYFYEKEDEFWHKNIHKNGGTKEENIKNTLSDIDDNVEFYVVLDKGRFAAFFGKFEQDGYKLLQGFHVGKEYRNKDFMQVYWRCIKMAFRNVINCGICDKNIYAINHLLKQGFEIKGKTKSDGLNILILTLKIL